MPQCRIPLFVRSAVCTDPLRTFLKSLLDFITLAVKTLRLGKEGNSAKQRMSRSKCARTVFSLRDWKPRECPEVWFTTRCLPQNLIQTAPREENGRSFIMIIARTFIAALMLPKGTSQSSRRTKLLQRRASVARPGYADVSVACKGHTYKCITT